MSLITHDGKIVTVDGKGLTFDQLRSELDTANGSESVTLAEAVANTEQAKTAISSAITAKGGTVGSGDGLADFPAAIAEISGGGGSTPKNPVPAGVNFIDYDGSVVETWAPNEIAGKAALPSNPNHSSDIIWGGKTIPLTAEGWNFTLAQIQAYFVEHPSACMYVGQMYHTTDGKLYMCVTMHDGRLNPASRFTITGGTATIDWGDGTAPISAVSNADNEHTYANGGDYLIAITPSDGAKIDIIGNAISGCYLLQKPNNTTMLDERVYSGCINHVFLPSSVTSIGSYAFYGCCNLSSIALPSSVTSIEANAFYECYALSSIVLPSSVTSIEANAFYECYALSSIVLPASVTNIGSSAFYNCYCFSNIAIPSSVTNIGSSAFRKCFGLGFIRFESTTPPSVANSNAFTNIPTDCIIYVPAASLDAYKTATNYPSPSTYTYIGY